jgi:hypothetical protein
MAAKSILRIPVLLPFIAALFVRCSTLQPGPGEVVDEAMAAHRSAVSFPAADEDYFHGMDGGIALDADEVKGRNMWLVWTGGNDRFWDSSPRRHSAPSTCSRFCPRIPP